MKLFVQEIEFIKQGSFSPRELDAIVSALKLAGAKVIARKPLERGRESKPDIQKSLAALEAMGVRIFGLNEAHEVSSEGKITWDNIAGYDQQKRYAKLVKGLLFYHHSMLCTKMLYNL